MVVSPNSTATIRLFFAILTLITPKGVFPACSPPPLLALHVPRVDTNAHNDICIHAPNRFLVNDIAVLDVLEDLDVAGVALRGEIAQLADAYDQLSRIFPAAVSPPPTATPPSVSSTLEDSTDISPSVPTALPALSSTLSPFNTMAFPILPNLLPPPPPPPQPSAPLMVRLGRDALGNTEIVPGGPSGRIFVNQHDLLTRVNQTLDTYRVLQLATASLGRETLKNSVGYTTKTFTVWGLPLVLPPAPPLAVARGAEGVGGAGNNITHATTFAHHGGAAGIGITAHRDFVVMSGPGERVYFHGHELGLHLSENLEPAHANITALLSLHRQRVSLLRTRVAPPADMVLLQDTSVSHADWNSKAVRLGRRLPYTSEVVSFLKGKRLPVFGEQADVWVPTWQDNQTGAARPDWVQIGDAHPSGSSHFALFGYPSWGDAAAYPHRVYALLTVAFVLMKATSVEASTYAGWNATAVQRGLRLPFNSEVQSYLHGQPDPRRLGQDTWVPTVADGTGDPDWVQIGDYRWGDSHLVLYGGQGSWATVGGWSHQMHALLIAPTLPTFLPGV